MNFRRAGRRLIFAWNTAAPILALWLWTQGCPWWGLGAVLSAHALWFISTLWPACSWCGSVFTRIERFAGCSETESRSSIWLTIDDGPDPIDTPLLLDLLDAHQARATFFFIGSKAAAHPELVKEVIQRGHEVGNHTLRHPQYSFWAMGPRRIKEEIMDCQQILQNLCGGSAPKWFRAPAGLKNPFVFEVTESVGLLYAGWSARGLDGVEANPEKVLSRLRGQASAGGILLMHEGRIDDKNERLAPKVLSGVLKLLDEKGWKARLPDTTNPRRGGDLES